MVWESLYTQQFYLPTDFELPLIRRAANASYSHVKTLLTLLQQRARELGFYVGNSEAAREGCRQRQHVIDVIFDEWWSKLPSEQRNGRWMDIVTTPLRKPGDPVPHPQTRVPTAAQPRAT